MITGEIKTLYSDKEKTTSLFPRTKTSAVSDADGRNLDVILDGYLKKYLDESNFGLSLPTTGERGQIFFKQVVE